MSSILRVRWTVTPIIAPRPLLACAKCGAVRPFKSSGKTRLNANGKQLSAWLIYRCATCEETWNRPIFERQSVRSIDPTVLHALQSNDQEWTSSLAFDVQQFRRARVRFEEFSDVEVLKQTLSPEHGPWSVLEILFSVLRPTSIRLDRLLAAQLHLSRTRIQKLKKAGHIHSFPNAPNVLRRPVTDGMRVGIGLAGESDGQNMGAAATCGPGPT